MNKYFASLFVYGCKLTIQARVKEMQCTISQVKQKISRLQKHHLKSSFLDTTAQHIPLISFLVCIKYTELSPVLRLLIPLFSLFNQRTCTLFRRAPCLSVKWIKVFHKVNFYERSCIPHLSYHWIKEIPHFHHYYSGSQLNFFQSFLGETIP